jgi:uncharacterized membrane protein YdbT with pleckstrin-like domain
MADSSIVEVNKGYLPLIARIAFISVGLDALFFALYFSLQNSLQLAPGVWVVVYIVKLAFFLYLTARAAYRWAGTYYHIDEANGLLVRKVGIHFPKETAFSLKNLHSVYVYQSPLGKILKVGDLSLTFTNREGNKEELRIAEVVDPNSYKVFFDKYLSQVGSNGK